jgi:hypothetical protein
LARRHGDHSAGEVAVPLHQVHDGIVYRAAVVVSWLLCLGGCGGSLSGDGGPADLRIRTSDSTIDVPAHSYSSASEVADGPTIPSEGPEHVIEDRVVEIEYADEDWAFTLGGAVAGVMSLEPLEAGHFRLIPPTCPGIYDVWAHGTDGDDVRVGASFVFRWIVPGTSTPTSSPSCATSSAPKSTVLSTVVPVVGP